MGGGVQECCIQERVLRLLQPSASVLVPVIDSVKLHDEEQMTLDESSGGSCFPDWAVFLKGRTLTGNEGVLNMRLM